MSSRRKQELALVDKFLSQLRKIMLRLTRQYPEDADFRRLQKRLSLAIDATPMGVMEIVGEKLHPYAEKILSDDEAVWGEFFNENYFDADIKKAEAQESRREAGQVVPKRQRLIGALDKKQKISYLDMVRELVDIWIDILGTRHHPGQ